MTCFDAKDYREELQVTGSRLGFSIKIKKKEVQGYQIE